jgi:hypothetical protein
MKSLILKSIILLLVVLKPCFSFAQIETTKTNSIDINKLELDKNFIQTITVKGEDLEKFASQNLEEAINVWFFGAYPAKASMIYIVDGNINNDLNAYSPSDIEEVSLVINALTILSGLREQQLVIVKTRKSKGSSGIKAFVGISSVSTKPIYSFTAGNLSESEKPELFHHYYIGGYKNIKSTNLGVSVDYSRDVFPSLSKRTIEINPSINRIRINSYLTSKIGSNNFIEANINYYPQDFNTKSSSNINNNQRVFDQNSKSYQFSSALKFTQKFGSNFLNSTELTFNKFNNKDISNTASKLGTEVSTTESNYLVKSDNYRIRNHFTYTAKFNKITLIPILDAYFRKESFNREVNTINKSQMGFSTYNFSTNINEIDYTVIPSVNLYVAEWLNVNAGISINKFPSSNLTSYQDKANYNPFISLGYDFSNIWSQKPLGFKIFSSFALSNPYLRNNQFDDYNAGKLAGFLTDIYKDDSYLKYFGSNKTIYSLTQNIVFPQDNQRKVSSFLLGSSLPVTKKIKFEYTYEKRDLDIYYLGLISFQTPFIYSYNKEEAILNNHFFSLKFNQENSTGLSWLSIINFKIAETNYKDGSEPYFSSTNVTLKDWDKNTTSCTAGFVNRISYKNFKVEADLLAHLNQKTGLYQVFGGVYSENYNSVNLQNLSVGYQIKSLKSKDFEVFANARNLYYNEKSNVTDGRNYYGIGFRAK